MELRPGMVCLWVRPLGGGVPSEAEQGSGGASRVAGSRGCRRMLLRAGVAGSPRTRIACAGVGALSREEEGLSRERWGDGPLSSSRPASGAATSW